VGQTFSIQEFGEIHSHSERVKNKLEVTSRVL